MLEIPEAITIASQLQATLTSKTVKSAIAAAAPHKFAWYHRDPADYSARLSGNVIQSATAYGGMVQVTLDHSSLLFSDGVNLRYIEPGCALPPKYQLLLTFTDSSTLAASVQMYGGLLCWENTEELDNPYFQVAREKPSPLNDDLFTEGYFLLLLAGEAVQKLSLKATLATEQRIPGLGNGVLQDILWNARLSPKHKINTLTAEETHMLFTTLKHTLAEMTCLGGRDTEKDLFGNPGGYPVVMSAKNNGAPCPNCGTPITKEAYMGGSVYFCSTCQPV